MARVFIRRIQIAICNIDLPCYYDFTETKRLAMIKDENQKGEREEEQRKVTVKC
jgi:hypothetical protein